MPDRLFSGGQLSNFLSRRESEMYEDAILKDDDAILKDDDAILNHADEVSARLRETYSLKTVAVNRDGINAEREQDPDNEDLTVIFFVPFTGNQKLLEYKPSSRTSMSVEGEVQDNEIICTVTGALSNEADYFQRKFDRWFDNMKVWLDGANEQADDFNSSLHAKIKTKIADRAERIRRADAVMGGLDFPEATDNPEVKSN